VLWNVNGSRVAENVLITAALRCLPSHVTRHRAGRPAAVGAALRQLRGMCAYADSSVACREPDSRNCAGCETGDLAGATLVEHCCADSCAACNRSARCVPPTVFLGDPHTHEPARRERLEAYLGQKDRELPDGLRRWRAGVGRPRAAAAARQAKQQGGQAGHGARVGASKRLPAMDGRVGAGGKKPGAAPLPRRVAGAASTSSGRQKNGTAMGSRLARHVGLAARGRVTS